ncbi:MAG: acyltransferase [Clostridiales Family XIII bacterium]|jgi:surface polysaccharide O-acyltransferase-like enzyme|nr:acyltransferase [Clostridiales Family XIII bacterium]
MSQSERKSNMELLRLILMVFIVAHHFIVHGLKTAGYYGPDTTTMGLTVNSFVIVGVNGFVLISGYFGIRARWESFLRLYLMLVFYALVFFFCIWAYTGEVSPVHFLTRFLPFSHEEGYWFIGAYFLLFLLSPLLELSIKYLDRRRFLMVLGVLGFIEFYLGFFWPSSVVNRGYSLYSFIFLYYLGRYLCQYQPPDVRKRRYLYLFGYVAFSAATAGAALLFNAVKLEYTITYAFAYSSPLVVGASVCLLLFFRSLSIQSKPINWLAASVLSAYLVQEQVFFRNYIYGWIYEMREYYHDGLKDMLFVGARVGLLSVMFVITCIWLDKAREYLMRPLMKLLLRIDVDGMIRRAATRLSGAENHD